MDKKSTASKLLDKSEVAQLKKELADLKARVNDLEQFTLQIRKDLTACLDEDGLDTDSDEVPEMKKTKSKFQF